MSEEKNKPARPFEIKKGQLWVKKVFEPGNIFVLGKVIGTKGANVILRDYFNDKSSDIIVKKPLDHFRYISSHDVKRVVKVYDRITAASCTVNDAMSTVFNELSYYQDLREKPRQQKLPLEGRKPDLPKEPAHPPVAKPEAPMRATEPGDPVFKRIIKEHEEGVASKADKQVEAAVDQIVAEAEGRVAPKVVREPFPKSKVTPIGMRHDIPFPEGEQLKGFSMLERSLLQKQLEHHLLMAKAIKIALGLE